MRKPAFYIVCSNKYTDQLCGNRTAISAFVFTTWIVQSLYFLNPKFQASSHLLWLYNPDRLCRTWSETLKTGFLMIRLFCHLKHELQLPMRMPVSVYLRFSPIVKKPKMWYSHTTQTLVGLSICPVWSVFAVGMEKA